MVPNQAYLRYFPSELNLSGRVAQESKDYVAVGSFGAVYKGILDGTTLVAIKVPNTYTINNPKCSKVCYHYSYVVSKIDL
jgi:hypothetical protein